MNNEQIIAELHILLGLSGLTFKQQQALAWSIAKLTKDSTQ